MSRQLTAAIVDALAETGETSVLYRDLAAAETPDWPEGQNAVDAFLAADTVVIGAPMYNFGIPHQLKAWINSILVARRTFRYTEKGAEGLAGGRRVFVVYSSGGVHGAASDFVEPYLRTVFRMVGIDDITVIRVEGVAITPETRKQAIDAALASIPSLVAKAA